MSAKPILFNTEMVRAILDGRKTVTRRVVKLKYSNTHLEMFTNKYGTRLVEKQNEEPGITTIRNPDGTTTHKLLACIEREPPYHPGDILYVRETWNYGYCDTTDFECQYNETFFEELPPGTKQNSFLFPRYFYRTKDLDGITGMKWRPSVHMPRKAARIFLRVTNVSVAKVQDITGKSARAEGYSNRGAFIREFLIMYPACTPESWVWVIEFERISKEEAESHAVL